MSIRRRQEQKRTDHLCSKGVIFMSRNRCPWCGKKINRFKDGKNVRQRITPAAFRFARCSHCHEYYGQNVRSKRVVICFICLWVILLIGCLLKNGYIALSSLIFALVAITSPLEKMNEKEEVIKTRSDKAN